MALHSRILEWRTLQNYWRILWTEEPGVLQSRGSQKSDMTCLNHHPRMLQRNQLVVDILLLAGLVQLFLSKCWIPYFHHSQFLLTPLTHFPGLKHCLNVLSLSHFHILILLSTCPLPDWHNAMSWICRKGKLQQQKLEYSRKIRLLSAFL